MFYLLGKNSETSQTKKFLYVQGSRLVLFKNELLIYFMDYKHHAVHVSLSLSPIFYLLWLTCNIMWDIANNSAPENIKRAITRISEVHSYSTRSSLNDDFYTENIQGLKKCVVLF